MNRVQLIGILLGVIVTSAGMFGLIIYPRLLGEHFDYFDVVWLDPDSRTQALMINLSSNDTLYCQFSSYELIVFWVEDPAGIPIEEPSAYLYTEYGRTFKIVAESSGVYSLVFSSDVPYHPLADHVITVDVRYGITPHE